MCTMHWHRELGEGKHREHWHVIEPKKFENIEERTLDTQKMGHWFGKYYDMTRISTCIERNWHTKLE